MTIVVADSCLDGRTIGMFRGSDLGAFLRQATWLDAPGVDVRISWRPGLWHPAKIGEARYSCDGYRFRCTVEGDPSSGIVMVLCKIDQHTPY